MRPIMAKAIGYLKPDIDPNTRLYVPFNEGVGSVAKDYSQYGNHAQLTDVEWSNEGFNGAGKFNGSSSVGDCSNDASLNITDAITIEAWFYPNSVTGYFYIVNKKYAPTGTSVFAVRITNSKLVGLIYTSAFTAQYGDINILTDTWQHVVMVYDGSKIRLYVNGVADTTGDKTGNIVSQPNEIVTIGKRVHDIPYFFNGTIVEVRIYNLVPNPAQIAADCYEVVCS